MHPPRNLPRETAASSTVSPVSLPFVTINTAFQANDILLCTLLLADQKPFRAYIEVLRVEPIHNTPHTFRLHGRFIRMSAQDREFLVRTILHLQREHLTKHYSA
jgi:c-di-GMP-binding flagellar brake protein YcgR